MSDRLRVLAITKIFPNAREPLSAPFNRQQFEALSSLCDVEVLATVPWYRLRGLAKHETIAGLCVSHPRFLSIPRVGHALSATLYAASLLPDVLARRGRVDVLLASWAYPDGAAVIALGELLGIPTVVKLHGSDINVVAKMPGPRANLRVLLPRAARVVAVSRALGDEAIGLGVSPSRLRIVRNGVDETLFRLRAQAEARAALGRPAAGKWIVYVGRLEKEKGLFELLEAFVTVAHAAADATLVLVGDGSARADLEARARTQGIGERVHFAGAQPLERVPLWMASADLVTLPSWNEGTPNVLLEALACGRPIVATDVGGIPDVVTSDELGILVGRQQPAALASALTEVLSQKHDASRIAALGHRGGWRESASQLHDVLQEAVLA